MTNLDQTPLDIYRRFAALARRVAVECGFQGFDQVSPPRVGLVKPLNY